MRVPPASAYTALGLERGADRSAVEEAYRRLIKLYHPDRSGGDPVRAAEINQAYRELRHSEVPEPVAPAKRHGRSTVRRSSYSRLSRPKRRSSRLWPIIIGTVASLLLIERERLVEPVARWLVSLADPDPSGRLSGQRNAVSLDAALLDGPLRVTAIADSIGEATRLARPKDQGQLADHSRICHLAMRLEPTLDQLDRCAAFDDAAALADPDPVNDRGAFGASAITARQMTAASLLTNDYLAIERRLDRIRTLVEMTLPPSSRR